MKTSRRHRNYQKDDLSYAKSRTRTCKEAPNHPAHCLPHAGAGWHGFALPFSCHGTDLPCFDSYFSRFCLDIPAGTALCEDCEWRSPSSRGMASRCYWWGWTASSFAWIWISISRVLVLPAHSVRRGRAICTRSAEWPCSRCNMQHGFALLQAWTGTAPMCVCLCQLLRLTPASMS